MCPSHKLVVVFRPICIVDTWVVVYCLRETPAEYIQDTCLTLDGCLKLSSCLAPEFQTVVQPWTSALAVATIENLPIKFRSEAVYGKADTAGVEERSSGCGTMSVRALLRSKSFYVRLGGSVEVGDGGDGERSFAASWSSANSATAECAPLWNQSLKQIE